MFDWGFASVGGPARSDPIYNDKTHLFMYRCLYLSIHSRGGVQNSFKGKCSRENVQWKI